MLVGLLRLVCLLDGRYMFIMISDPQQNVSIHFLINMFFNNSFYIASHGAAINLFFWTSPLFLFSRPFYLSTQFLCFDPYIFCHLLVVHITCFRVFSSRFWQFLVLFLDPVHAGYHAFKLCHVPQESWITTSGTTFTGICFGVSKE